MEKKVFKIDSIDSYHSLYELPTRHPLVSVIDLKEAKKRSQSGIYEYGVYALFLKNGSFCSMKYGRRSYDYQAGSIVTFAPGHRVDVEIVDEKIGPDVVGLMFHPDIIYGTPLADKINKFRFFDYSQTEALHLSDEEREKFLFCLSLINEELKHPVDSHSASLLCANIQLLLEHIHRFYDRQFITRHKVNSEVVERFEEQLKEYYDKGNGIKGMPNVSYFANLANLTPGYFGDLIRKETGSSPKDIIALYIMSRAKMRLAESNADISTIAYEMGFEYPAHFTRMFKRLTGQSPTEYRASLS